VVELSGKEVRGRLEMIKRVREEEKKARERLSKIKHKIAIISGKGGVGKSFVSASLGVALSQLGRRVGILDADFHGPSIPKILGVENMHMVSGPSGVLPVMAPYGIKVVSIEFMLPSHDTPVIWRGPLKAGALRQLLSMVDWGELDYLVVDLPPGTGDEPLSVAQLINDLSGAIVVTIPSDLSRVVVEKAVVFARQIKVRVLGIVENMSYFVCPSCGAKYKIFGEGAGRKIAEEMGVDFLGSIPIDPRISECVDRGEPFIARYPETETAKAIMEIAKKMIEKVETSDYGS